MSELLLNGARRLVGEGPLERAIVESNAEIGAKAWIAEVKYEKVLARGFQKRLEFVRGGRLVQGSKDKGLWSYHLRPGAGYLAATVFRGSPAKHMVVVEDDGEVGFCAVEDVLAEYALAKEGRSFADERAAAIAEEEAEEASLGIPALEGSLAQVAWGASVRRAVLRKCPGLRGLVAAHPDAKWWIDNRAELENLKCDEETQKSSLKK